MGIVMITMPGASKLAFADALHAKTNGGVDLVIVQKSQKPSLGKRFSQKKKMFKNGTLFKELWYGLLLRFAPQMRDTLTYFREPQAVPDSVKENAPRIIEVDSVNSDETHALLEELSPDLLVVWGSKILKPHIIKTAKHAINLHIGRCPHYRGTLANQHAILSGDFSKIGATVHYIVPEVDAGDIISIIEPDFSKQPKHLFQDLLARAQETYINVAARLHAGEKMLGKKQDMAAGKILRLEEWTPEIRYKIAKRMHEWERGLLSIETSLPQKAASVYSFDLDAIIENKMPAAVLEKAGEVLSGAARR